MNARQWTLVGALGVTLVATWWAAQIEESGIVGVAEVVEPTGRRQSPHTTQLRTGVPATVSASEAELAVLRDPWPASGANLLQSSVPAKVTLHGDPAGSTAMATVPALPFTFIGSVERGSRRTVMLMEDDVLHLVGVHERIGERYRVERVTPTQIEFTYLPTQQRQVLEIGQD